MESKSKLRYVEIKKQNNKNTTNINMFFINFRYNYIDNIINWEGNNLFYLNCLIITGPQGIKPFLLMFMVTTLPVFLFLINSLFFNYLYVSLAYPILIALLYVYIIINLVKLCFYDPGILPRRILPKLVNSTNNFQYNYSSIINFKSNYIQSSFDLISLKKLRLINQKGVLINYKICHACLLIKPLRSHHCGRCDNCIESYEFHCNLFGSCIGKRNTKYFYILLITGLILYILMLILSVQEIIIKVNIKKNESLLTIDTKLIKNYKYIALNSSISPLIISMLLIFYIFAFILPTIIQLFLINIVKSLTVKEFYNFKEIKNCFNSNIYFTSNFVNYYYQNNHTALRYFVNIYKYIFTVKSRLTVTDKLRNNILRKSNKVSNKFFYKNFLNYNNFNVLNLYERFHLSKKKLPIKENNLKKFNVNTNYYKNNHLAKNLINFKQLKFSNGTKTVKNLDYIKYENINIINKPLEQNLINNNINNVYINLKDNNNKPIIINNIFKPKNINNTKNKNQLSLNILYSNKKQILSPSIIKSNIVSLECNYNSLSVNNIIFNTQIKAINNKTKFFNFNNLLDNSNVTNSNKKKLTKKPTKDINNSQTNYFNNNYKKANNIIKYFEKIKFNINKKSSNSYENIDNLNNKYINKFNFRLNKISKVNYYYTSEDYTLNKIIKNLDNSIKIKQEKINNIESNNVNSNSNSNTNLTRISNILINNCKNIEHFNKENNIINTINCDINVTNKINQVSTLIPSKNSSIKLDQVNKNSIKYLGNKENRTITEIYELENDIFNSSYKITKNKINN